LSAKQDILELKFHAESGRLCLHGKLPLSAIHKIGKLFTCDPHTRCYQAAVCAEAVKLAHGIGARIDGTALANALQINFSQQQTRETGDCVFQVGQFVSSSENSYGVGKFVKVEGASARIVYFDCPAYFAAMTELVPLASLKRVELARQTRAYVNDETIGAWIAGRVVGPLGDRGYVTVFPNHDSREVKEQDLFVRWSVPIEDPTTNLASRLSESYLYAQRQPFVEAMIRQRAVCGGMSGLLSSAIELEEHQLQVVRKILQDPIQRYLLADEVGLGKTIEAGIVLRQHVLDSPTSHQSLVLVPQLLVQQWKTELAQKFFLDPHMAAGKIQVLAYDGGEVAMPNNLSMLVIDEAHRFGAFAFSPQKRPLYDAVCRITEGLDRFLLLSATPVLHNEESYLAMLHLLDPEVYGPPEVEIDLFRAQIHNRQVIADAYDTIKSEFPGAFILNAIDSVIDTHLDDMRLKDLRNQIEKSCDWDVPPDDPERMRLVAEVRTHIGECYKLHRRMIRTRRGEEISRLLPGRCGVEFVDYRSAAEENVFRLIDEWRIEASMQNIDEYLVQRVRLIYEAATEGPEAFMTRAALCSSKDLQRSSLRAACQDWKRCSSKLEAVEELLRSLLRDNDEIKILLFAGSREARDKVVSHLSDCLRWKITTVARDFVNDGPDRVLVCDAASEEGLNLRVRRGVVVHYDLPLNANRLEQRLGRMDRYGVGSPVKSYVLLELQNDFMRGWFHLFTKCFKVFDRSIASLQYAIDRETKALWQALAENGIDAFGEIDARLSGEKGVVEQELKAVTRQDALDAVEVEHSDEAGLAERISTDDPAMSRDFCVAAGSWLNALGFRKHREPGDPDGRVCRYGYLTETCGSETLVPLHDMQKLLGVFDPLAPSPPFSKRIPGTYALTYDRIAAVNRGVHLARFGEPLVDWLYRFSRQDERGTASIFWRWEPGVGAEVPYALRFCFDVLAEADIQLESTPVNESRRRILQRKSDDLFPPKMWRVWVDPRGRPVESSHERSVLSIPFRKEKPKRDFNMNYQRWAQAPLGFATADWSGICDRARAGALRWVIESDDYRSHVTGALARGNHCLIAHRSQLEARLALKTNDSHKGLSSCIENERIDNETILAGIQTPRVCIMGACAIFLSDTNPFVTE
jgi:ATP-dependent helicase HepA